MNSFSCKHHNDNEKRCYLKLFMMLMDTRYYSKLNSTVSIVMFNRMLEMIWGMHYPLINCKKVDYWIFHNSINFNIKCCGGHDENGNPCTTPIIEPDFLFNQNKNQLSRCQNHLDQPFNQCDTLNYFTSIHQYSMCY
jgi:hypothetical protein